VRGANLKRSAAGAVTCTADYMCPSGLICIAANCVQSADSLLNIFMTGVGNCGIEPAHFAAAQSAIQDLYDEGNSFKPSDADSLMSMCGPLV